MKGWKYEKKQEKEVTLETIEQRKRKERKNKEKAHGCVDVKRKRKEKDGDKRNGNCVELNIWKCSLRIGNFVEFS